MKTILECLGVLTDKTEDARQGLIHDTKTLEAIAKTFVKELDQPSEDAR